MQKFCAGDGSSIHITSETEQLKFEHVLQSDRAVWLVIPRWPYLAIDAKRLRAKASGLTAFPVFSNGQLWQNMNPKDIGARLIGSLAGGGIDAGLGANSGAFVAGKANSKANHLRNFNPPLLVGSTPWCALGTHVIYVDSTDRFQHAFGSLITVNRLSRPSSAHYDFTELANLRDQYNDQYFNGPRDGTANLDALSQLLDRTFQLNAQSLAVASAYHASVGAGLQSVDYDAPTLTKYERMTRDGALQPKIEVAFALLHYEKALNEFDGIKRARAAGNLDGAFSHGVYCVVAVAACIEAIANRLVFAQTSSHPTYQDRRAPLRKLNEAAEALAAQAGASYVPLAPEMPAYERLEAVRILRNRFMHANESAHDMDPAARTSALLEQIGEQACRSYLAALRTGVGHVFDQLPALAVPIVTRTNVTWMGDLEVP